ncbi:MAG: ATP-binding cassette domain-containing protein, partial [Anaerolineales bacterium]|nr:ATP-binding cassette domain-containing protein [Anaerolineales bacterium]
RGHGIPWRGNYSSWLEQKQDRLAREEKSESQRQKTLQRELEWLQMTPKAKQTKRQARINRYNDLLNQDVELAREEREIFIPPGRRLGDVVVRADGISKAFGDKLLYENLSFDIPPGAIVGIVGPNGAGKTTLFRMITDQDNPDDGSLRVGETVDLGYVDQSRDSLNDGNTVWQEISGGEEQMMLGGRRVNSRAFVSRFNFSGSDQQKLVGDLSGGERNRVHLAKILKSGANVLLLDEPSNDLDVNTLRALEDALESFAGSALVISHDRWFLDRVATHIMAFEGDSEVYWFIGNYAEYEQDRKRRLGAAAERPKRITYRRLRRD